MKKILLPFVMLLCFSAFSQEKEKYSLSPCGTTTASQINNFQDLDFSRSAGDTVLYVPLTIHQLSNGNSQFMSTNRLLDNFKSLNQAYAESKIQFFIEGDIRFLKNTKYNSHDDIPTGADMMFKNNIANTLNIYFVSKAAGNCGYNLPYAGIAMSKGCTGLNNHTWTHELCHALRLPHPFLGWELTTYNSSKPTPTKVTYDYTLFKDSLILNQTIIDTALVEFLDKSNCAKAADLICDTRPDYYSFRWPCDAATKLSQATLKDPNGAEFKVDGTLYMSYSSDDCQNRFSADEIATMRAWLINKKKNLLYNQVPNVPLPAQPTVLLNPADKGFSAPDNTLLKWEKVPNAKYYYVEGSRLTSFSTIEFEGITQKTEFLINNLAANKLYYWRVRPFNSHFVGEISPRYSFTTSLPTAVKNLDKVDAFIAYPNPIEQDILTLKINSNKAFLAQITVADFTGKNIFSKKINFNQDENNVDVLTQNWAKGIYLVSVSDEEGGIISKKIVKN